MGKGALTVRKRGGGLSWEGTIRVLQLCRSKGREIVYWCEIGVWANGNSRGVRQKGTRDSFWLRESVEGGSTKNWGFVGRIVKSLKKGKGVLSHDEKRKPAGGRTLCADAGTRTKGLRRWKARKSTVSCAGEKNEIGSKGRRGRVLQISALRERLLPGWNKGERRGRQNDRVRGGGVIFECSTFK